MKYTKEQSVDYARQTTEDIMLILSDCLDCDGSNRLSVQTAEEYQERLQRYLEQEVYYE